MTSHIEIAKMIARLIEHEHMPSTLADTLYRTLEQQQLIYADGNRVSMPIQVFEALLTRAMTPVDESVSNL